MTLCKRVVRKNRSNTFFVASDCHPQTIAVVRTRAEPLGLEVVVGDPDTISRAPTSSAPCSSTRAPMAACASSRT
jgi:glycine cleavage system pyridoxal-binding protein P